MNGVRMSGIPQLSFCRFSIFPFAIYIVPISYATNKWYRKCITCNFMMSRSLNIYIQLIVRHIWMNVDKIWHTISQLNNNNFCKIYMKYEWKRCAQKTISSAYTIFSNEIHLHTLTDFICWIFIFKIIFKHAMCIFRDLFFFFSFRFLATTIFTFLCSFF